jgi:hypothetical protein
MDDLRELIAKMESNKQGSLEREILRDLTTELEMRIPGFKVRFKAESKFQRFIGKIASLFGTDYLGRYVTTLGKTVWFPDRGSYEANPKNSAWVLLHEWVHLHDYKRWWILFYLSYFFLLPVVFTMRGYWERRGYTVDIIIMRRQTYLPVAIMSRLQKVFCSFSGYFWMWPFPKKIYKWVEETLESPPTQ